MTIDPLDSMTSGSMDLSDCSLRSGFEPELSLGVEGLEGRSGFEPELGGVFEQKGVYVDETTCIGCLNCAHVARNTFYIEPDYGRSRVIRQDGDSPELVQEAIDTCPVDCIHWVNYQDLKNLEEDRKYQVIQSIGLPADPGMTTAQRRRAKLKLQDGRGRDLR
jgi:ferredoxin